MLNLIRGLEDPNRKPAGGSPASVARAVFWSFFGVRRNRDLDSDAATITPLQVVVAGLAGAVVLVLALLALVRLILA